MTDEDDMDWLLQEFALTAERAKDRGMTPAEFLIGLQRYGQRFLNDYSEATES